MFPSRRIVTSGGDVFRNEYSLQFDGTDSYVNCGNDSSLQIAGDMTYSCWFKTSSSNSLLALIDKIGSNTGMFIFLSAGKPRIWIGTGSAVVNWENIGSDLRDGNWHHLVVVNDEDVATYAYIDGTAYNNGTATDMSANTTDNFNIGSYSTTAWEFDGLIDEVAIWNTALSSSQVKTLYNNREPFNAKNIALSSLKAYYRMGDGVLDDRQTNGLVADQVNATLGSELLITTGWSTDDGWTLSGGTLTFSDTGNGGTILTAGEMTNGTGMAIGKVYKLQYTISNLSSGTADITIHNSDGNVQIANENATNGSYTKYFTPTHDGKGFRFTGLASSGSSWDVTDYSLKEVSGNAGVMVNFDGSDFKTDTH